MWWVIRVGDTGKLMNVVMSGTMFKYFYENYSNVSEIAT